MCHWCQHISQYLCQKMTKCFSTPPAHKRLTSKPQCNLIPVGGRHERGVLQQGEEVVTAREPWSMKEGEVKRYLWRET